jgi:hypothetical protein
LFGERVIPAIDVCVQFSGVVIDECAFKRIPQTLKPCNQARKVNVLFIVHWSLKALNEFLFPCRKLNENVDLNRVKSTY